MVSRIYPIKKALVSVYDKRNLEELGGFLKKIGCEVYSTGGTADFLRKTCGLNVVAVDSVTDFPEMMDGRVKTLHPKVFGGILARRENNKDLEETEKYKIPLFDLIVVNLYPFWEHIGKPQKDQSSFIDIGGPSMLRAASKNCTAVTVLSSADDYKEFQTEVEKNQGTDFEFRYKMAARTFARTAQYDSMISQEWLKNSQESVLPQALGLGPQISLRYGENPHQKAAWSYPQGKTWEVTQGKELSYNNLLDAESATRLVNEFQSPSCVVVKHNNPCGVSTHRQTTSELFKVALSADPKSAFGGIVAFNREVDEDAARELSQIFLEVIVAPSFSGPAKEILAQKKNLRLIEWPEPKFQNFEVRSAMGGFLVQETDGANIAQGLQTVSKTGVASDALQNDLKFAWTVCKHVRSNAIVIAREGKTLGIGAGQMSRVDAVQIAIEKAKAFGTEGAVLASDAFFPFRDNIDLLKGLGIKAVIEPGGSQRDEEVIAACNEQGIALVFTGERHFRH